MAIATFAGRGGPPGSFRGSLPGPLRHGNSRGQTMVKFVRWLYKLGHSSMGPDGAYRSGLAS